MPAHTLPAEVPKIMANTFARSKSVTVDNGDVSLLHAATIGRGPISDIAVEDDILVVTNFGDNTLAVLDSEALTVRGGVVTGQPFAVAVCDARAYAAVSSASDDAITVVDSITSEVVAAYPVSGTVTAMTVSVDRKHVFVARAGRDGVDVVIIDTADGRLEAIEIASGTDTTIDALRVDAAGRRLFVATSDSVTSRMIVVDVETGRVRSALEFGAPIRGLELGLDSTAFVLTSDITNRGVLHVVDLVGNRVTATVNVGSVPTQLALSADGALVFVVDYDRLHVVCTETRTVVGSVSVGARPSCVAVSPGRLYVADYAGGVTSYAVSAPAPMMYAPFAVANSLAAQWVRELEPAGV
jgi:DNA-binding beta-propeller fold protein YncE